MTNTRQYHMKMKDGALVVKFKQGGKEIFERKIAGSDFKTFWELMKCKVELENHQHVEQANKMKGDVTSIELMLRYVYNDQFRTGWSEAFFTVLKLEQLGPVGKEVAAKLEPTEEELRFYEKRCGSTGYPLLKCIETKHIENFHKCGSPAPTFELYKSPCPKEDGNLVLTMHRQDVKRDCSSLRKLCREDSVNYVNASELISCRQLDEGNRLVIYNHQQLNHIGDAIAHAAVEDGLICIRKRFPNTRESTYEEGEANYFIENGLHDEADSNERTFMDVSLQKSLSSKDLLKECRWNYDNETERSYNYVRKSEKKCLIIIEGCDGVEKNQKVGDRKKACGYLGNVIGKILFPKARVVVISCEPRDKPALCFQRNLPDRYASVADS